MTNIINIKEFIDSNSKLESFKITVNNTIYYVSLIINNSDNIDLIVQNDFFYKGMTFNKNEYDSINLKNEIVYLINLK